MLNDQASNGRIEASLDLFNIYLVGAQEMGIDRNPELARV